MDQAAVVNFTEEKWEEEAIPELIDYIRIPNKSPMFDPDWQAHGFMEQAVQQFVAWAEKQPIPGMKVETVRLEGRTPLIYIEVPGQSDQTILLYGHLDKQPEMTGWREGLDPWIPKREGDKLYGRGGADDGYALFSSLIALEALQEQGIPHARCVILIEASEESGSPDLPFYVEALSEQIGNPDLVICLDSGCGNYDQMWCTTSLRGMLAGTLRADIIEEGVHSGDASGVVPSSFRILRQILGRVEDLTSGRILPEAMQVAIPESRILQAKQAAEILGNDVFEKFPFVGEAQPVDDDLVELILNRTWRSTLSVTGVDGMPSIANAGNVLRPYTAFKLSFRLPPTCDATAAALALKPLLEAEAPYGAKITFSVGDKTNGWHAPELEPWLEKAVSEASRTFFGRDVAYMGEGGTIPFMGMLGELFPKAQFLITGVLGPQSNAHGPNEFLHIPTAKKLTACVADIVARHYERCV